MNNVTFGGSFKIDLYSIDINVGLRPDVIKKTDVSFSICLLEGRSLGQEANKVGKELPISINAMCFTSSIFQSILNMII